MRQVAFGLMIIQAAVECVTFSEIGVGIAVLGAFSVWNLDMGFMKCYMVATSVYNVILVTFLSTIVWTGRICSWADDATYCTTLTLILKVIDLTLASVFVTCLSAVATLYCHLRPPSPP